MNIREQIIKQLDKPAPGFEYLPGNRYEQLKSCLILKPGTEETGGAIVDDWFKGVIESLYYRPNKFVLVLEGEGVKNSCFTVLVRGVFPPGINIMGGDLPVDAIPYQMYDTLIISTEFTKNMLWLPTEDNFKVERPRGVLVDYCDKRLASYCTTTDKWVYPQRKNYIVLHLESINQELFNSIPKDLLWIEIFNKFKPEGK